METATHARARPASRLISGAICFLGLTIIASAFLLMRTCTQVSDAWSGIFKEHTDSKNVLGGSVTDMRKRLRLIVEEADITAEVSKSETYSWWKIYFGTTTARVRSTGCHVQYVIPLESFGTSDIEAVVNPNGARILRVRLPEPQVNEDIVEVNYNNLEVEAASAWARFNKGDVAEEAKKLLRQSAIEEARKPWHLQAVKADAEPEVRRLLGSLIEAMKPDVKFEIQFVPSLSTN